MTLQVELQKQIADIQARGEFTSIATLPVEFQKKVMPLAAEFSASFSYGTQLQDAVTAIQESGATDAADEFSEDDVLPANDGLARLMLLGAMYVEENERLSQLDANVPMAEYQANEKQILTECFCALDMGTSGIDPERVREVLKTVGVLITKSRWSTLAWLLKEGHHAQLTQLIAFCKANPSLGSRTIERFREQADKPLAYDGATDEAFRRGLILAESKQAKLTTAGIRGWDFARYVHVMRFGYMTGFIQSGECWLHLQRLHKPTLSAFTGWHDYVHSYSVGYRWWSGTAGPIEDACQRLLGHPKSPWI